MWKSFISIAFVLGITCTPAAGESGESVPANAGQPAGAGAAALTYDGSWSGTTAQAKEVSFEVANGKITSFSARGLIKGAGCSTESGTTATVSQPITGNAFSLSAPTGPGGVSLSVKGKFLSPTKACGVVQMHLRGIPGPPPGVPGHVPSCSGVVETRWQAARGSAPGFDEALDCPGLVVQAEKPEPAQPTQGRAWSEEDYRYFISNLVCGDPPGTVQLGRPLKCQLTMKRGLQAPSEKVVVELYWSNPSGMLTNFVTVNELPSPGAQAEVTFQIKVFSKADLDRNLDFNARFTGKPKPTVTELTAVARVTQPVVGSGGWVVGRKKLSNEISTDLKIVDE